MTRGDLARLKAAWAKRSPGIGRWVKLECPTVDYDAIQYALIEMDDLISLAEKRAEGSWTGLPEGWACNGKQHKLDRSDTENYRLHFEHCSCPPAEVAARVIT